MKTIQLSDMLLVSGLDRKAFLAVTTTEYNGDQSASVMLFSLDEASEYIGWDEGVSLSTGLRTSLADMEVGDVVYDEMMAGAYAMRVA